MRYCLLLDNKLWVSKSILIGIYCFINFVNSFGFNRRIFFELYLIRNCYGWFACDLKLYCSNKNQSKNLKRKKVNIFLQLNSIIFSRFRGMFHQQNPFLFMLTLIACCFDSYYYAFNWQTRIPVKAWEHCSETLGYQKVNRATQL